MTMNATAVPLSANRIAYKVGQIPLLEDIELNLTAGTVHALIGPNGAGKSTLLKVLAGDVAPSSGTVYVDGRPLDAYSKQQLALKRAVMPQDVAISLTFTSEEVVSMGRYPHIVRGTQTAGRNNGSKQPEQPDHAAIVEKKMQHTDTTPLRKRIYPTLSGGEQARVTLARVLAQQTSILFLDEPTASLDPRHQHLVLALARRHARRGGVVFAVLHDLNLAAAYADDIVLLKDGRVQAQGSPVQVLQPSILEEVFQTSFYVTDHPLRAHPLILSLPATS